MATQKKPSSILESLNLSGLENAIIESKSSVDDGGIAKTRAMAPVEDLGPLEGLVGQWAGTGFNIVQLPNRNIMHPDAPLNEKFTVVLNATSETLQFDRIGGEVLNRGNVQDDITFFGLHYLQQVSDVNLPVGKQGIHLETGLFLNIPKTGSDPISGPTVARLGSIPHGDSLLAQGSFRTDEGPFHADFLPVEDTTPLLVQADGSTIPDPNQDYVNLVKNATLPPGIPPGSALNPNLVLAAALGNQTIVRMTTIFLSTKDAGGIVNIPFVNNNAKALDFSAIFWLEEIEDPNGNFMQLQYTQKLFLEFEVFNKKGEFPEKLNVKWPHVSVGTLRLPAANSTS